MTKKHFISIAKNLRKSMTDAEIALWSRLRARQLHGCKFRRQQPIGNYIVDFVSFEKKIVVEVDGGQHAINKEQDSERDQWLESQGFRVLRFWNNDILGNIEGVLEIIGGYCNTPSPNPSHKGRGFTYGTQTERGFKKIHEREKNNPPDGRGGEALLRAH